MKTQNIALLTNFLRLGWSLLIFCPCVFAQPVLLNLESSSFEADKIALHNCQDAQLEVQFLCNPEWQLEEDENLIFIIIQEDNPAVTMTVAKSQAPVVFLEQLTESRLQEMGKYADGFNRARVPLAETEAIRIKAFPRAYPELRLIDYYLLHNDQLYSILFSINPKERAADYEPLIKKIVSSFKFLPMAIDKKDAAPSVTKGAFDAP